MDLVSEKVRVVPQTSEMARLGSVPMVLVCWVLDDEKSGFKFSLTGLFSFVYFIN